MPRLPLPRQLRRRASGTRALIVGVALPAAVTLLLPVAPLPPFWGGLGTAAWPVLALSLAALAGAIVTISAQAWQHRDLKVAARRTALAVALLSPIGASLAAPALLALLLLRDVPLPRPANDNERSEWDDAAWVPVSTERARLVRDKFVA